MEGKEREQHKPSPGPWSPLRPRGFRKDRALSVIKYSVQNTVSGNSRLPLQRGPPRAKQLVLAHLRQERAQAGEQRRESQSNVVAEITNFMNGTSDEGATGRRDRPSHPRTDGRKLQRAHLTAPTGWAGRGGAEEERDEGAATSCSPGEDNKLQDELDAIDRVARLYGDLSEMSDAELDFFGEEVE